jgi:predicted component of type VI protein secretion system
MKRLIRASPEAAGAREVDAQLYDEADPEGWLVVAQGGGLDPGMRFDAFGGVSIGRSSDADIRIDDRYASSIHARVYPAAGGFILEDMRSTNGTTLNGHSIDGEAALEHGDRIAIGDTELIFEAG